MIELCILFVFIDSISEHIILQFSRSHVKPLSRTASPVGRVRSSDAGLCVLVPTQSDPALSLRGGRLPQEEPVQADGGPRWAGRHRHRGGEHPHSTGQGHCPGDYL